MIEKCPNCGGLHYRTDPCRPKLERSTHKEATVGSDDNSQAYNAVNAAPSASRSNTPPKPRKNRNEYLKRYMAEVYRPRVKARKALIVNQTNPVNAVVNDG